GRAYKGEDSLKTAKRKLLEEVNLKASDIRLYGIYEDHYKRSAWGVPTSSISIVYMALIDKFDPKPDKTIETIKLSEFLPERLIKNLKLFR
ncbi:MAG: NUDIX domain-containing protein, partial [Nanoarchaeota archaeon]